MAVQAGCFSGPGLSSSWKQGRFLNDARARNLDVIVASENWLNESTDLFSILGGHEIFTSAGRQTGASVGLIKEGKPG